MPSVKKSQRGLSAAQRRALELDTFEAEDGPSERRVLEETAEEIRQVAKEARAVIEEAYDGETLDAFSEALAPAFKNSLSPDFYKPPAPEAVD